MPACARGCLYFPCSTDAPETAGAVFRKGLGRHLQRRGAEGGEGAGGLRRPERVRLPRPGSRRVRLPRPWLCQALRCRICRKAVGEAPAPAFTGTLAHSCIFSLSFVLRNLHQHRKLTGTLHVAPMWGGGAVPGYSFVFKLL